MLQSTNPLFYNYSILTFIKEENKIILLLQLFYLDFKFQFIHLNIDYK
jgi:hypothetical protein